MTRWPRRCSREPPRTGEAHCQANFARKHHGRELPKSRPCAKPTPHASGLHFMVLTCCHDVRSCSWVQVRGFRSATRLTSFAFRWRSWRARCPSCCCGVEYGAGVRWVGCHGMCHEGELARTSLPLTGRRALFRVRGLAQVRVHTDVGELGVSRRGQVRVQPRVEVLVDM